MHRLTFASLLFIAPATAPAQDNAWKAGAIRYVQEVQTGSGGFLAMAPGSRVAPTLRATSSAVRALSYLGGKVPDQKACVAFVDSCFDAKSGGFAEFRRGKPDVTTTAVGIMAVKDLGMSLDKYKASVVGYLSQNAKDFEDIRIAAAGLERLEAKSPKAEEWTKILAAQRNPDGTFGKDARTNASYAVTWLRLGNKLDERDNILKALRAGQRKDGGFGKVDGPSDLESSYRILRCFMMMKAQPADVAGLRGFIQRCRNEDGGFGVSPGQPSTVGATYFAAIIDHWLPQP